MADHAAVRNQIMEALQAEPKPIARDRALEVARGVMSQSDPALISDFAKWFEKHGDPLVERLNG